MQNDNSKCKTYVTVKIYNSTLSFYILTHLQYLDKHSTALRAGIYTLHSN